MASDDEVDIEDEISQEEEEEEVEDEEEAGTSSRKRVSIVWSYFEKVGRSKVRCTLCNHEQNYHKTTGNILRHLKSKHNIDATVKAQTGSTKSAKIAATMQRIKSQDGSESSRVETGNRRTVRNRVVTYEETDIDPYTTDNGFENYLNLDEEGHVKTEKPKTVEEQRILAEIDYFREKAAYYRMQKNLVALQAKKVKLELDQIA